MIRNSIDHGIETPNERKKAGKSKKGFITINSFVEGNTVVIQISDDGRGMDPDVILAKAIENKIVPSTLNRKMTDHEKLGLIFAPGFSTSKEITNISGRGVGMDVVKSNINQLKGTVSIESKVGEGTSIQLRFPLSVVVMRCLYIYMDSICYAIPLDQVDESIAIRKGELFKRPKKGEEKVFFPVFSLKEILWDQTSEICNSDTISTLHVHDKNGNSFGLAVDYFSYMEESIIHSVDSYISSIPGIQGGIIRKDGTVTVALHIDGVLELAAGKKPIGFAKIIKKKAIQIENFEYYKEAAMQLQNDIGKVYIK